MTSSQKTNMEHQSKWWAKMIEKHGSEEAVRDFMRAAANRSSRNKGGTGGWAKMKQDDPEKLKQLARAGGKKSRRK